MRLVFILVAALVVGVWALAAREFAVQYQRYAQTRQLVAENGVVDRLLEAGRDLVFERGRVNLRLSALPPVDEQSSTFIAELRRRSGDNLTQALPRLPSERSTQLAADWMALDALRPEVDRQLQLPLEQRNADVRGRWMTVSSDFLTAIQHTLHLQALRLNRQEPAFRLTSRIKLQVLNLREALGAESTAIGGAAAQGQLLDPAALQHLARLRGKSDALMEALRNDIEAAVDEPLLQALDDVERQMKTRLQPLQDKILAHSLAGTPILLTAREYSAVAVPVLEQVAQLFVVAQGQCAQVVAAIEARATTNMVADLVLTLVALVFGAAALLILRWRLLAPLRRIGRDLRALDRGDSAVERGEQGDEIEELRDAVVALRNALSDRQVLWDAAPDFMCVKDEQGRWRSINGAAVRYLRVEAQAVRGRTDAELVLAYPHLEAWLHASSISDAMAWKAGAAVSREEVIVGEDGEAAFFQVVRIPLFHGDGSRRSLVLVGRDVTDRRRAEAAAARLARQHQLILECAGEGITGVDAQGRTIFFNPAASRMTGWDVTDLIGQPQHPLLHHSHGDGAPYPESECPVIQTLADGVARHCDEDLFWCKDGSSLPVEFSVTPLIEQGGGRGAVVIFRDIRARLSDQAEIQSLLSELKRSNTELERFAYVASHDLRQPLRMISGYMALLKRRLAGKLNEDEETFFGFATDGALRMDRMICDLLDYSRIGRTRELEPVDLNQVMQAALDSLAVVADEAGARITVATDLPAVLGVRSELERLFQNLMANAIKFRAPDRIPEVSVGCRDGGAEWVLSVHDNGIGIRPEDHARLFAIFQRLVPQEQYEGTGIGLASVRKIAEHHGGRVWVESELGEGATFLVALPKKG